MSIQKLSEITSAGVSNPTFARVSGGTVTSYTSGVTYEVHTYTTVGNDTLTILSAGVVDILCVGGGGCGGQSSAVSTNGGGGGGGGAVVENRYFLLPGTYTVTVGNGGTPGNALIGGTGTTAGASLISTVVIAIGGSNAIMNDLTQANFFTYGGANGGGGMAGAAADAYTGIPALWPSGNAGSNGHTAAGTGTGGGGGGGAGGAGTIGTASVGGNGGSGLASTLYDNTTRYYGAGGGGARNAGSAGTGGSSVGGNGGTTTGSNGATNTGSGGGGAYSNNAAGSGGSGIVVVRTVI